MVVLAASAAERIHRQIRAPVLYGRMIVLRIADGVVRACDIAQGPEIRHYCSRI